MKGSTSPRRRRGDERRYAPAGNDLSDEQLIELARHYFALAEKAADPLASEEAARAVLMAAAKCAARHEGQHYLAVRVLKNLPADARLVCRDGSTETQRLHKAWRFMACKLGETSVWDQDSRLVFPYLHEVRSAGAKPKYSGLNEGKIAAAIQRGFELANIHFDSIDGIRAAIRRSLF